MANSVEVAQEISEDFENLRRQDLLLRSLTTGRWLVSDSEINGDDADAFLAKAAPEMTGVGYLATKVVFKSPLIELSRMTSHPREQVDKTIPDVQRWLEANERARRGDKSLIVVDRDGRVLDRNDRSRDAE